MATMAFAMPIIPGKEQADRENIEMLARPGAEHDAYVASRRAKGFTREAVWHQKTPNGTMAIVVIEADDVEAAMGQLAMSDDPADVQFRQQVKDVHGFDLASDEPPEIALIADMRF